MTTVILLITFILFNLYSLFFVYAKANACECAQGAKLNVISSYIGLSLCIDFVLLYMFFSDFKRYNVVRTKMLSFLIPLTFVYVYVTYIYVEELKSKACQCVDPIYIHVLYYISLATSVLVSGWGIILLIGFLMVGGGTKRSLSNP